MELSTVFEGAEFCTFLVVLQYLCWETESFDNPFGKANTAYANIKEGWYGKSVPARKTGQDLNLSYDFYSPNGIKYEMDLQYRERSLYVNNIGVDGEVELYTQTIVQTDLHGNWIRYDQTRNQISITANDGRQAVLNLEFKTDASLGSTRPYYIPISRSFVNSLTVTDSQGDRVWNYTYEPQKTYSWCGNSNSGGTSGDDRKDCLRRNSLSEEGLYRLTDVDLPDGTVWKYEYSGSATIGKRLYKVTIPYGGIVQYSYSESSELKLPVTKREVFPDPHNLDQFSEWMYQYDVKDPTSYAPSVSKKTTVTYPIVTRDDSSTYGTKMEVIFNHDHRPSYSHMTNHYWGEILERNIYEVVDGVTADSTIRSVKYEYHVAPQTFAAFEGNQIQRSAQQLKYLRFADVSKITVDDKYITEFSNLDDFYNWQTKTEATGENTRVTQTTYLNLLPNLSSPVPNLMNLALVDVQTVSGNGKSWLVDNTFNVFGQLTKSVDQGITNEYEYDASGHLYKHTYRNHLGIHEATYEDYYRGQAQLEKHPNPNNASTPIEIKRSINDSGTVAWEEDALGNRTSFSYDEMNRVSEIQPPGIAKTEITYTPNNVHVHRSGEGVVTDDMSAQFFQECSDLYPHPQNLECTDNKIWETIGFYKKDINLDGLGRKSLVKEWASDQEPVYKNYQYDLAGRLEFESQVSLSQAETKGIQTTYDALDQAVKVTNTADSTQTLYSYSSQNVASDEAYAYAESKCGSEVNYGCFTHFYQEYLNEWYNFVKVTDPNSNETIYQREGFGHPDNAWNIRIELEEGIYTDIVRNALGDIESVAQGDVTREYTYYPGTQRLHQITEPERGVVTHSYDEGGNLRTRQVGSAPLETYSYDVLNRLASISYADSTADKSYTYYDNDLLKEMSHGPVKRNYAYTAFGSLDNETLTVGPENESESFSLDYGYNQSGFLNSLSYPSGSISVTMLMRKDALRRCHCPIKT